MEIFFAAVLAGDEDSLLDAKTTFKLEPRD